MYTEIQQKPSLLKRVIFPSNNYEILQEDRTYFVLNTVIKDLYIRRTQIKPSKHLINKLFLVVH